MQPSENELRAFVGPNADYYLEAWKSVEPNDDPQRLRWNWPAFFLNVVWLLYRRMYKYFWIAAGVEVAIGAVQGFVEELLGIPAGVHGWDFLINVSIATFFGRFGTWMYYRHAERKIAEAKAHDTSQDAIARAGGVRWLLPILAMGVALALGIVAAVLVPGAAKAT